MTMPKGYKIENAIHWREHPRFSDFMRLFDAQRVDGQINYRALWRSIKEIDPSIPYNSVYHFFRKMGDPFLVRREIMRGELRDKKKRIADAALKEVMDNPAALSLRDRIRLGEIATREELVETKMVLEEKHKQKKDSLIDSLLDQARYGTLEGEEEKPTPFLDKRTEDLALPDPNTGTSTTAAD